MSRYFITFKIFYMHSKVHILMYDDISEIFILPDFDNVDEYKKEIAKQYEKYFNNCNGLYNFISVRQIISINKL